MEEGVWMGAGQDVKDIQVQLSTFLFKLASHNYASLKYWLECGLVIYS